jgi:next-to-BRCA1 protein 1
VDGPVVHDGITCKDCGADPIIGIRFKCTGRDAYDMCATCEGAKEQPFPTIKIYRSDPTVQVKGWGTNGKSCPANPFGLRGFPAPVAKKGTKGKAAGDKKRACSESPEWRRQVQKPTALFISDSTSPDTTVFPPSAAFLKTWVVRNDGPGDWPSSGDGVRLVSVGGDRMCPGDLSVPVESLKAGSQTEVSVSLQAPAVPGRYVAYFRLKTLNGVKFGQRLWVHINVEATASVNAAKELELTDAVSIQELMADVDFVEEDFDFGNVTSSPEDATIQASAVEAIAVVDEDGQGTEKGDDEALEWRVELDTLSAMGFRDTRLNVELLKKHAKFSFSQHPHLHGKPFSDSFSTILDALVK